MEMKQFLWYSVLGSVTLGYLIAMVGIRAAKQHDVSHHSRHMITACAIVGIWLIAYVAKQMVFGREVFPGTPTQYWQLYVPVFVIHMLLAVSTIALASINLYVGLTKLRMGTGMGAMVAGVSLHRQLGHWMTWTFSGTILTAYLVYLMLFVWFASA
jgi:uncharacterized membrane protein YozB (DUF420 family)